MDLLLISVQFSLLKNISLDLFRDERKSIFKDTAQKKNILIVIFVLFSKIGKINNFLDKFHFKYLSKNGKSPNEYSVVLINYTSILFLNIISCHRINKGRIFFEFCNLIFSFIINNQKNTPKYIRDIIYNFHQNMTACNMKRQYKMLNANICILLKFKTPSTANDGMEIKLILNKIESKCLMDKNCLMICYLKENQFQYMLRTKSQTLQFLQHGFFSDLLKIFTVFEERLEILNCFLNVEEAEHTDIITLHYDFCIDRCSTGKYNFVLKCSPWRRYQRMKTSKRIMQNLYPYNLLTYSRTDIKLIKNKLLVDDSCCHNGSLEKDIYRYTLSFLSYFHLFLLLARCNMIQSIKFILIHIFLLYTEFLRFKICIQFPFKTMFLIHFALLLITANYSLTYAAEVTPTNYINNRNMFYSFKTQRLINLKQCKGNSSYEEYPARKAFLLGEFNEKYTDKTNNGNSFQSISVDNTYALRNTFRNLLYYNLISSKAYEINFYADISPSRVIRLADLMIKELIQNSEFSPWSGLYILQSFETELDFLKEEISPYFYGYLLADIIAQYAADNKMLKDGQLHTFATSTAMLMIRVITLRTSFRNFSLRNETDIFNTKINSSPLEVTYKSKSETKNNTQGHQKSERYFSVFTYPANTETLEESYNSCCPSKTKWRNETVSTNENEKELLKVSELDITNQNNSKVYKDNLLQSFSVTLQKELLSSEKFLQAFSEGLSHSVASVYSFSMAVAVSNSSGLETISQSEISVAFEKALHFLGRHSATEDYAMHFSREITNLFAARRILFEKSERKLVESVANAMIHGLSSDLPTSHANNLKIHPNNFDLIDIHTNNTQFQNCKGENGTLNIFKIKSKMNQKFTPFFNDEIPRDKAFRYLFEIMDVLKASLIFKSYIYPSFVQDFETASNILPPNPTFDEYMNFIAAQIMCLLKFYGKSNKIMLRKLFRIILNAVIKALNLKRDKNDYCMEYGLLHETGNILILGELICHKLSNSKLFINSFQSSTSIEIIAACLFSVTQALCQKFSFIPETAISVSFVKALQIIQNSSNTNSYAAALAYEIAKLLMSYKPLRWEEFQNESDLISKTVLSALPRSNDDTQENQYYEISPPQNLKSSKPLNYEPPESRVFKSSLKRRLLESKSFREIFQNHLSPKIVVRYLEKIAKSVANVKELNPIHWLTIYLEFFKNFKIKNSNNAEKFSDLIAHSMQSILDQRNIINSNILVSLVSVSSNAIIRAISNRKVRAPKQVINLMDKIHPNSTLKRNLKHKIGNISRKKVMYASQNHFEQKNINCSLNFSPLLRYNILSSMSITGSFNFISQNNMKILMNCFISSVTSNKIAEKEYFEQIQSRIPKLENNILVIENVVNYLSERMAEVWCSKFKVPAENFGYYPIKISRNIINCIQESVTEKIHLNTSSFQERNTTFSEKLFRSLFYNILSSKLFLNFIEPRSFNISLTESNNILKCALKSFTCNRVISRRNLTIIDGYSSKFQDNSSAEAVASIISVMFADILCSEFQVKYERFLFLSAKASNTITHCFYEILNQKTNYPNRSDSRKYGIQKCIDNFSALVMDNILSSERNHKISATKTFDVITKRDFYACILVNVIGNKMKKNFFEKIDVAEMKVKQNNITDKMAIYSVTHAVADLWCSENLIPSNRTKFYSAQFSRVIINCTRTIRNQTKNVSQRIYAMKSNETDCFSTISALVHYYFQSSNLYEMLPNKVCNSTIKSIQNCIMKSLFKNGILEKYNFKKFDLDSMEFGDKSTLEEIISVLSKSFVNILCSVSLIDRAEFLSSDFAYCIIRYVDEIKNKDENYSMTELNEKCKSCDCCQKYRAYLYYSLLSSNVFSLNTIFKITMEKKTHILNCIIKSINNFGVIENKTSKYYIKAFEHKFREKITVREIVSLLSSIMAELWCSQTNNGLKMKTLHLTEVTVSAIKCLCQIYDRPFSLLNALKRKNLRASKCSRTASVSIYYNLISSRHFNQTLSGKIHIIIDNIQDIWKCILIDITKHKNIRNKSVDGDKLFVRKFKKKITTNEFIFVLSRAISKTWCSGTERTQFHIIKIYNSITKCINQIENNYSNTFRIGSERDDNVSKCLKSFTASMYYNLLSSKHFNKILSNETYNTALSNENIFKCMLTSIAKHNITQRKLTNFTRYYSTFSDKFKKETTIKELASSISNAAAAIWCSADNVSSEISEFLIIKISHSTIKCITQTENKYKNALKTAMVKDDELHKCFKICFPLLYYNILSSKFFYQNTSNEKLDITTEKKTRLVNCMITSIRKSRIIQIRYINFTYIESLERKLGKKMTMKEIASTISSIIAEMWCSKHETMSETVYFNIISISYLAVACISQIEHKRFSKSFAEKYNSFHECSRTFSVLVHYNIESSRVFYQFSLNETYNITTGSTKELLNCVFYGMIESRIIHKQDVNNLYKNLYARNFQRKKTIKDIISDLPNVLAEIFCSKFEMSNERMEFHIIRICNQVHKCLNPVRLNIKSLLRNLKGKDSSVSRCLKNISLSIYYNIVSSNFFDQVSDKEIYMSSDNKNEIFNCVINSITDSWLFPNQDIYALYYDLYDKNCQKKITAKCVVQALSNVVAEMWCAKMEIRTERSEFHKFQICNSAIKCLNQVRNKYKNKKKIMEQNNIHYKYSRIISQSINYNILSSKLFNQSLSEEIYIPVNIKKQLLNCVISSMIRHRIIQSTYISHKNIKEIEAKLEKNMTMKNIVSYLSNVTAEICCTETNTEFERSVFNSVKLSQLLIKCFNQFKYKYKYFVNAKNNFENRSKAISLSIYYNIISSKLFDRTLQNETYITSKNKRNIFNCIIKNIAKHGIIQTKFINFTQVNSFEDYFKKKETLEGIAFSLSDTFAKTLSSENGRDFERLEFHAIYVALSITKCMNLFTYGYNDISHKIRDGHNIKDCLRKIYSSLYYNLLSSEFFMKVLSNETANIMVKNKETLLSCIFRNITHYNAIQIQNINVSYYSNLFDKNLTEITLRQFISSLSGTVAEMWCSTGIISKTVEFDAIKVSIIIIKCINHIQIEYKYVSLADVYTEISTPKCENIYESVYYNLLSSKLFQQFNSSKILNLVNENNNDFWKCMKNNMINHEIIKTNNLQNSFSVKFSNQYLTLENIAILLSKITASEWCSESLEKLQKTEIQSVKICYSISECVHSLEYKQVKHPNLHAIQTGTLRLIAKKRIINCSTSLTASLYYNFLSTVQYQQLLLLHASNLLERNETKTITDCIKSSIAKNDIIKTKVFQTDAFRDVKFETIALNETFYSLSEILSHALCSESFLLSERREFNLIKLTYNVLNCLLKGQKKSKTIKVSSLEHKSMNAKCSNNFFNLLYYNIKSSRSFNYLINNLDQHYITQRNLNALLKCIKSDTNEFYLLEEKNFYKIYLIISIFMKHNFTVKEIIYIMLDEISDIWCSERPIQTINLHLHAIKLSGIFIKCLFHLRNNNTVR